MRIKKVIGVGAMVGGLGLGAAACGPVNVHWETYPTGTSSSLRTAEQHWWVNGGGNDLLSVNRAGTTLLNDVTGHVSQSKANADANALIRTAAAAARNPYPGNSGAYVSVLNDYRTAAQDALANNPVGALTALSNANTVQNGAGWATDFPATPAHLTK
jgi:hypothetical protein